MNRRTFIEFAAGGAAALATPVATNAHQAMQAALARPGLIDVLHDTRIVSELGRKYRAAVPAERDASALTQAMLGATSPATPSALRQHINERVQRDFDAGETIMLDGWILSVTEARQCALYSLHA